MPARRNGSGRLVVPYFGAEAAHQAGEQRVAWCGSMRRSIVWCGIVVRYHSVV